MNNFDDVNNNINYNDNDNNNNNNNKNRKIKRILIIKIWTLKKTD